MNFAESFAKRELRGLSVGLIGELGAGKTTFVRFVVEALGSPDSVSSPTYTLEHEYRVSNCSLKIEHWDLYRVSAIPEDLLESTGTEACRFIEWVDLFPDFCRELDIVIAINLKWINSSLLERELVMQWK